MAEDPSGKPDKELTLERLVAANKINIARKIQAGEVVPARELEGLKVLEAELRQEKLKASCPSAEPVPSSDTEVGIPERLRVRRRYTVTESARQQRRRAALGNKNRWVHGKYAKGFISGFLVPCKKTCKDYPCALVEEGRSRPGGLCGDKVEVLEVFSSIAKALQDVKDPERFRDIEEVMALKAAAGIHIVGMLQEDVIRDGTLCKREKLDKEGRVIGHEIVSHPSLSHVSAMLSQLGLSLSDLRVTPKARASEEDDEKGARTLADLMSGLGRAIKGNSD